jgi:DNA-binding XRE family transcriptional regulator
MFTNVIKRIIMGLQDNKCKRGRDNMKIKLKDPVEFRRILIVNGFSQAELAKTIQVTQPYINQIVNEERFPTAKIAKKITDELNLEFNDILFIDDVCKCEQGI